jgi:hypothetical protein
MMFRCFGFLSFFSRIGIHADVIFRELSCRFCLPIVGLYCLCGSCFFISYGCILVRGVDMLLLSYSDTM